MLYEILDDNGNVVNTIVANQDFVEQLYPGHYRLVKSPPVFLGPPIITKVAMISRFTNSEYVGILSAAKTDVEVQAWVDVFYAANQVNLADPRTRSGLQMMVSKNLLTQARADEILNTPVSPLEEP